MCFLSALAWRRTITSRTEPEMDVSSITSANSGTAPGADPARQPTRKEKPDVRPQPGGLLQSVPCRAVPCRTCDDGRIDDGHEGDGEEVAHVSQGDPTADGRHLAISQSASQPRP
jgi:hypothetical protein